MKNYAILLFISILSVFFASCDKAEAPPSYIHIKNMTVEENINSPSNIGSLQHTILNTYVMIRDEASSELSSEDLGFQNIPSTFPYLGNGLSTIKFTPAVPINGSRTSIAEYPFFEQIVLENYDLTALKTDTFDLVTRYKGVDKIDVLFNEDFEANSSIFRDYATDAMEGRFVNQIDDVYEGTQSGHIHLDLDNSIMNVATTSFFALDANQPYLELNYKTEARIDIGLVATNGSIVESEVIIQIFAQETPVWKKSYYQLKDAIAIYESRGFTNFQFYLATGLPFGAEEADVYFDNIKLLKQR